MPKHRFTDNAILHRRYPGVPSTTRVYFTGTSLDGSGSFYLAGQLMQEWDYNGTYVCFNDLPMEGCSLKLIPESQQHSPETEARIVTSHTVPGVAVKNRVTPTKRGGTKYPSSRNPAGRPTRDPLGRKRQFISLRLDPDVWDVLKKECKQRGDRTELINEALRDVLGL